MKRTVTLIVAGALAILISAKTEAKPVDKATAAQMAGRVLNKAVVDATPEQFTYCYLFAGADGKGFVLMAADDCVRPVLGYSLNGTLVTPTIKEMSPEFLWWVEGYQREIESVLASGGEQTARWMPW